ncbi:hypothetical protein FGO68_gene5007 [Halteria grandinella]|uniref:Uncharacterized protein n=1 Tax=Halteria grandinella TaxID=5974 RepID=A0A8J8P0Y1_HALGN|nr:hypothetical protein FGO68_gene5007 [Halteria grandinella]
MDELHELLRRDDPNQPVRRHPRIEERKRKKHYNSVNKEKIQLVVGSPEYHGFIEHLQEVEDDPNYCVCLSCWRFVNLHQKRLHQFKGHETIPNGTITSESSFLHYNQLFQNLPTRKIVTLIQPLSLTEGSSREDLTNHLCSDLRFGSNFTGFTKGQPPYLNEPVCPFNLISSQFDPSGTHEEVQQELEMLGWYKRAKDTSLGKESGMLGQLKFGQFVNGYGKEASLMFMRMIEEAWLDVEATQGIMGEIGHMIREIRVRQGQRQYDII